MVVLETVADAVGPADERVVPETDAVGPIVVEEELGPVTDAVGPTEGPVTEAVGPADVDLDDGPVGPTDDAGRNRCGILR